MDDIMVLIVIILVFKFKVGLICLWGKMNIKEEVVLYDIVIQVRY